MSDTRNPLFPPGLPPHIAARFDGILSSLPAEVLAEINAEPPIDELIEELVHDLDTWLEHALAGDPEDQRWASQRIVCNLRIISILAQLKGNAAPMLIVFAMKRAKVATAISGLGNLRRNVPASPRPVTIPMRAHMNCTQPISGQVTNAVQSSAVPCCAPATE
jgi:hypothetical protein